MSAQVGNLHIYNQARAVPKEALKVIAGGRLSGKSDINPMWRIKQLTELFGPCGIGWRYVIAKQWLENGGNDEIAAFVNIELFFKYEGAWSEAIPGTGGSSFVAKEKSGPYTSDECFKMALTDAISVACKALGFGADVYWDKDTTKYNKPPQAAQNGQGQTKPGTEEPETPKDAIQPITIKALHAIRGEVGKTEEEFKQGLSQMIKREIRSLKDLSESEARGIVKVFNQRKAG